MKRIICLITALCLVFGSFSFVFADEWGSSQISSVVNNVSSINTTLSNIYTRLGTIVNYLYDGSHSVAFWAHEIATWMQPIYQALTSNLVANLNLEPIIAGLNEVVSSGGNTDYFPYLKYNGKSNANWLSDLYTIDSVNGFEIFSGGRIVTYRNINSNGSIVTSQENMTPYNWRSNLLTDVHNIHNYMNYGFSYLVNGYNSTQSLVSFADPDSTVTFSPLSATDGIYKYLNAINTPLARLGYVLASDSRIEAQEAAAANEQAVVDNFIDSNGAGSASPSDIGSVSDLSSGFSSNISTDADPGDIFDIFDSNNFSWFSQEVADSLDTTNSNNRSKSGSEFDTPLLDQRINDIYNALGVKHD